MAQGHGSATVYKLWLCDACGDHAEVEPGGTCEVCAEGTVQVVEVIPRRVMHGGSNLSQLRQAIWEASQFDSLSEIGDFIESVLREIDAAGQPH